MDTQLTLRTIIERQTSMFSLRVLTILSISFLLAGCSHLIWR